jgi:hypothetical protein
MYLIRLLLLLSQIQDMVLKSMFFPANSLLKKLEKHGLPLLKKFMLLKMLTDIMIIVEEEKDGLF